MASAGLPRSARLGYGIGSFCSGTFSTVPGLLLLYYLTNVLAVPAAVAGFVVFLPKVWDLVVNPLVGRLSDRTASRRPWLLAGAAALPPAFVLTFAGPPLRGGAAALYVGVLFLLAATAYALFEVPYKAMPAEMTDDYHQQSSLLTWRMGFLGGAILLSGGLAPAMVNWRGGAASVQGYRLMGLFIGAVLLVSMLATHRGTARAPRIARAAADASSLRRQLAAARGHRSFLVLLALSSVQMLGAGIMLAGAPYFATYVLGGSGAVTTLFLALVGPLVFTMPLWVRLSQRMDKRGAMVLASALFLAGGLALSLTPLFGAGYAHLCVLVIGVGYAGVQLLQLSMLADTLIADRLSSGARRAGLFTGLWTAAETVTFGFGALVLGWMLGLAGFVSAGPDEVAAQPGLAIDTVVVGASVVPAALMAVAIGLTLRYDLTATRIAELRDAAAVPSPARADLGASPPGGGA
jgi:GPH family glycoside/pentoside/hexuronide:cation symporter